MIIDFLLYIETLFFFQLMSDEVMRILKQSVPELLRIMDYVQFRTALLKTTVSCESFQEIHFVN